MAKTKRRPRPGVAEATRSRVELFREFYTRRLAASAAAWAERVPSHGYQDTVTEPDFVVPGDYVAPDYTWTKEDEAELAATRMRHRLALAHRPFDFGMATAVHGSRRAYYR